MLTIKIYSDYVCPYCFLAEQVLARAIQGKEALINIEWMPFELRPYPTPTLKPEGEYLQQAWQQSVYPMASELGVKIVLPSVSPQPYTHLAFEGFQFAQEKGKGEEYTHKMFTAFFQQEQNIGEIEVLTQLATEIGLDAGQFRQALQSRQYKEKHQQALKQAYQARISAVPTFIIGNKIVRGLAYEEDLARLIEKEIQVNAS